VVDAPFDDLVQDRLVDIGDRDGLARVAEIFEEVLDENGALGNTTF
jgi:hypothetical protein